MTNEYTDELRRIKSLLIVTSLQERKDLRAVRAIKSFKENLDWKAADELMVDPEAWDYAIEKRGFEPKLVFCHPDILLCHPEASLYYRGLCGLSIKAAKGYVGAIDNLEAGNPRAKIDRNKAVRMARTYNTFISTIISNSFDWTLENGRRTIIATLGITLDGSMRNRIGGIAEERVRAVVLEHIMDYGLLTTPRVSLEKLMRATKHEYRLKQNVIMRFGSEPDISFKKDGLLLATVEIKGGVDPAGALERYGAATKSFSHALSINPQCQNFFLSAVFTKELSSRISQDRSINKHFNVVDILQHKVVRGEFLAELFHHTLRLV